MKPWPELPAYDWGASQQDMDEAGRDYERDRADAAMERLRLAEKALRVLEAQGSKVPGSTNRADCMAVIAKLALEQIGPLP